MIVVIHIDQSVCVFNLHIKVFETILFVSDFFSIELTRFSRHESGIQTENPDFNITVSSQIVSAQVKC